MVPSYHLPAGFSSTYHRQLYGMEPASTPIQISDPTIIGMHAGIFYPVTAFRDPPDIPAQAERKNATGPLFLGADPLRTPKTAQRANPDLESS